jgi:hypothetical protein
VLHKKAYAVLHGIWLRFGKDFFAPSGVDVQSVEKRLKRINSTIIDGRHLDTAKLSSGEINLVGLEDASVSSTYMVTASQILNLPITSEVFLCVLYVASPFPPSLSTKYLLGCLNEQPRDSDTATLNLISSVWPVISPSTTSSLSKTRHPCLLSFLRSMAHSPLSFSNSSSASSFSFSSLVSGYLHSFLYEIIISGKGGNAKTRKVSRSILASLSMQHILLCGIKRYVYCLLMISLCVLCYLVGYRNWHLLLRVG